MASSITIIRHPSPADRVKDTPLHQHVRAGAPLPRGPDRQEQLGSQGFATASIVARQLAEKPDHILISKGYARTRQAAEHIADLLGVSRDRIVETAAIDQGRPVDELARILRDDYAQDRHVLVVSHDSMPGQLLYRLTKGRALGEQEGNLLMQVEEFCQRPFWKGMPESLDLSVPTSCGFTVDFSGSMRELLDNEHDLSRSPDFRVRQVHPLRELAKPVRLARDILRASQGFSAIQANLLPELGRVVDALENVQHEHKLLPLLYEQPSGIPVRLPLVAALLRADALIHDMHKAGSSPQPGKVREYVQAGGIQPLLAYAGLDGADRDSVQRQARQQAVRILMQSGGSPPPPP